MSAHATPIATGEEERYRRKTAASGRFFVEARQYMPGGDSRKWLPGDAWIDHDKTRVGYEIPFARHFYRYVPPRPLEEIDTELKALSTEIMGLLAEVTA